MLPHDAASLFSLVPRARFMRQHMTRSEALLWQRLRGRRLGVRFRRQHPFATWFIADFYAPSAKLVVEVDGGVHRDSWRRAYDERRQEALERVFGVRLVRVDAELVERDADVAVAQIRAALSP